MKTIDSTSTTMAVVQEVFAPARIPSATYRIQFTQDFTFQDARTIVPYLQELGITDVYSSPLLKPRSSSSHGYDISDHSRFNPALGSDEELEAFTRALRDRGMGLVIDTVPNHMGIGEGSNAWWLDVLENGPSSSYARYFDIEWHPVKPELENKLLLPILGDQYGNALESGQIRLAYEDGSFFIGYYEHRLPIAPRTYSVILNHPLDDLIGSLGAENEFVLEFQSILTALGYLPPRTEQDPARLAERYRETAIIKRRIADLYAASAEIRAAIDATVESFNGIAGNPRSFDELDRLIDAQAYRPAYWRVAAEEINYRRFFDINDLAAIRVELPDVFHDTHRLIFRLLSEGKATGLRIDHPDGLWNPSMYFRRLQESYLFYKARARLGRAESQADDEAVEDDLRREVAEWADSQGIGVAPPVTSDNRSDRLPLYVVAEKILSEDEPLPQDWAVHGTTGYDFLNAANGLFVKSANRKAFDRIYRRFIGQTIDFDELTNATKKTVMQVSLVSEINALSHQLERIAERNRHYRDFTLNGLTAAIREVIASMSVYRTYVEAFEGTVSERDRRYIESATREAARRNPRVARSVFDFVRDTLLLQNLDDFREEDRQALRELVMKFQQLTGPVMAKGVEDTAFYIYNRLVSLNEVGGHPTQFGVSPAEFHRQNAERRRRWPHSLLASSTHDTKRSEDVRARINVLSEIPEAWRAALARWSRLNASKKIMLEGRPAPDRNDEYLLYQTLVGAWPPGVSTRDDLRSDEFADFRERIAGYMDKATNEAKVHTSWVNPNQAYDTAVQSFVHRILATHKQNRFLDDFLAFQQRIAAFGRVNSLAQTLLKLTLPGVPDIYQGTELWDFSLVDPDNRRPVDYERRRALLAELREQMERAGRERRPEDSLAGLARRLIETDLEGRSKLYVIFQTLTFRRTHERLFSQGQYHPLEVVGEKQEHVCAFARILGDQVALVIVPRLPASLTEGVEKPPLGADVWKETWLALPEEYAAYDYHNLFTSEKLTAGRRNGAPGLPLAAIFAHFPVALLRPRK